MTTRSVRIPDDIDEKLTALAAADHISVNSAIVRAIEEVIARRERDTAIAAASEVVFAARADLFDRLADT